MHIGQHQFGVNMQTVSKHYKYKGEIYMANCENNAEFVSNEDIYMLSENYDVEEWVFTLTDDSTVTKRVVVEK